MYMSPGLVALGPGIFSVSGVTTTKLILDATCELQNRVRIFEEQTGSVIWQSPKRQKQQWQHHLNICQSCTITNSPKDVPMSPLINFISYTCYAQL